VTSSGRARGVGVGLYNTFACFGIGKKGYIDRGTISLHNGLEMLMIPRNGEPIERTLTII